MAGGPWDKYAGQPAPAATVGGLDVVPLPAKPDLPAAQTPAQAEKDTLEVEKLKRDLAAKPVKDPALAQAIKGLGLEEWLTNVNRARKQIDTGFATGVLGSLAGHFPGTPRKDFLGALEGIKGASILEKLQALREQSKNGASGMGSLTEQEGERLANSIAALNPDMSADELRKSLDIVERHAKALQAIGAGKNPTDPAVQKEFGIPALPAEKGEDKGITESAPLPTIIGEPQLQAATGTEKAVLNPKVAAIAPQLTEYLNADPKKVTNAMILGFVAKAGVDPKGWPELQDALAQRGKATFAVDPHFTQPMSAGEQAANAMAQSAPAAAILNAGNAATAGYAGNILGDKEGFNRALGVAQEQHPTASLAGTLAGGTVGALVPEAGLAKLGMAPGIARGAISDMLYGGAAGASDDDGTNALGRIANGALLGLGGSLAGQALLKVPGAFARGVTSPHASYVAREIPDALTIGQALSQSGTAGKFVKGLEDRVAGFNGPGDVINARRLEGVQKMNTKAFDRALEPIKGSAGGKFGPEAVQEAQRQVSAAYQKALGGKVASVDNGFIADAASAKNRIASLPPSVAGDVESLVDSAINDYIDPATLSVRGEDVQPLLQELEGIKSSYYSQNHPAKKRIGDAVDDMIDAVEGMFQRQSPDTMPEYQAAKKAFKRVSTLENAVLAAKNTDGVFTPAQLGAADKANTIKFGNRHMAAAGKTEFDELHRNTQAVLPSKVPDSGTAGRAALLLAPGMIAGSGAGVGYAAGNPEGGAATGLTLAGLLALAYTRGGQRAAVRAITGRGPKAQAFGKALGKAGRITGAAGASQAALPRD